MVQMVKNSPAMQETWVQFLGQEHPLQKQMATHSSILAWRIPWTVEPGGLQSMGIQRIRHNWVTSIFTFSLKSWSWMSGETEPKEISKSEHALRTTSAQIPTKGSFIYHKPVNKLQMKGGKKGENFIFDFYSELIILIINKILRSIKHGSVQANVTM